MYGDSILKIFNNYSFYLQNFKPNNCIIVNRLLTYVLNIFILHNNKKNANAKFVHFVLYLESLPFSAVVLSSSVKNELSSSSASCGANLKFDF